MLDDEYNYVSVIALQEEIEMVSIDGTTVSNYGWVLLLLTHKVVDAPLLSLNNLGYLIHWRDRGRSHWLG